MRAALLLTLLLLGACASGTGGAPAGAYIGGGAGPSLREDSRLR
jgi:hypothetical protein